MAWPTAYYRMDNTDGYTQEELDALNLELCGILADAYDLHDGELSDDERSAIMVLHAHEIAKRSSR